jgi:integrase
MNTPHRYQYGSLTRRKRIRTEDVWQFRYYEPTPEGRRWRRSKIIGVLSEYPTQTDALRILEQFRLRLNLQNRFGLPVTLDALADDFVDKELPLLRYGTQQAHLSSLNRWIRPRWGGCLVYEIKPIEVEQWLRSLPLAEKSKVNLRSLLHLVFQHGRRWEITDANPIDLVRQRGVRRSIPRVLSVHDVRLVLRELTDPYRTMVLIAACLGLRASETIGLQWGDFNWEDLTLLVRRSVVNGRVGDTKTEASRLPLPVDPSLADALRAYWQRSLHREPCDWVFANRKGKPRWQESILRRHIKPAAARVGVGKIGWHTFRHSYSSLLRRVGADIKVQQELLRHSTIQSTMNVYTQAMSEGKRAANSVVVRSVLPCETCCGVIGAQRGSEREPMGTEKLLNGCGGWI